MSLIIKDTEGKSYRLDGEQLLALWPSSTHFPDNHYFAKLDNLRWAKAQGAKHVGYYLKTGFSLYPEHLLSTPAKFKVRDWKYFPKVVIGCRTFKGQDARILLDFIS